jgi:hypothetical protein
MTLTELISEVYTITNRPDLISQTLLAVRSATLEAHSSDYYYKDIFETGIVFDASRFVQQFTYREIVPRFRAVKYLRKFDANAYPAPGSPGKFFTLTTPDDSLDTYHWNKEDIYYVAGDVIQVRSATEITHALFGCYLHPAIGTTDPTYISWIALDHPYAIVHLAASKVFRITGKLDEASAQLQLYMLELEQIKMSNITAEGM